jgi:hypothetical protein
MSVGDFHRSGLLYLVNSAVLWPLGLAQAVEYDQDTGSYNEYAGISVQRLDPPENIIDGQPTEDDHPRYRAASFIRSRIEAMSQLEREYSVTILRDPMNLAAFLEGMEPDKARARRPPTG